MTEVQVGTTSRPIRITPHIDGLPVTQQNIKDNYSNLFVDNGSTPLTFRIEYSTRGQTTPSTLLWDAAKSTENEIFFDMPDSFWATVKTWTVLFFWEVLTEKNYTDEAIQIEIKDLHKGR
jgi:hypothetical protein